MFLISQTPKILTLVFANSAWKFLGDRLSTEVVFYWAAPATEPTLPLDFSYDA